MSVALCVVWTLLAAAIPLAFMNSEWLLSLDTFRDPFLRSSIQQTIGWVGYEPLISLIILFGGIAAWVLARNPARRMLSICVLFGSVIVFVTLFLPINAPRIERYTQGAAIDFYKSLRDKEVYVKPLTMKSYAHLFYSQKPYALSAHAHGMSQDAWEPWLLNGVIDHPAYFVSKVNDASPWRAHKNLRVIAEHGGFVFFERITE